MPYIKIYLDQENAARISDVKFAELARLLEDATAQALNVKRDDVSVVEVLVSRGVNSADVEIWGIARKTPERLLALEKWAEGLNEAVKTAMKVNETLGRFFFNLRVEIFCMMPDATFSEVKP